MKKEHLELDIKKYMCMHTWHIHQDTRMQNKKQFTFGVHFNDEIAIDVAQTSPMTYLLI